MTPSEASVERMFSTLKYTWTARRNRSRVTTINNLLMIKRNAELCESGGLSYDEEETVDKYCVINTGDDGADSEQDEMFELS